MHGVAALNVYAITLHLFYICSSDRRYFGTSAQIFKCKVDDINAGTAYRRRGHLKRNIVEEFVTETSLRYL